MLNFHVAVYLYSIAVNTFTEDNNSSEIFGYLYTEAIIHATRGSFPMLASDASSGNSPSSTQPSKATTRHSDNPALQKKPSSNLLVTNDFSGVHSVQDKVPSISTSKQPSYTKSYSKTKNGVSLNSDCDSIDDDHVKSAKSITAAAATTTTSQAFCGGTSITPFGIEETKIGYKQSYVVLIGKSVRTVNTKLYASLPVQNRFMVKQREQNLFGRTIVKLVLKSSHERLVTFNMV